jgi:hypothetical protein
MSYNRQQASPQLRFSYQQPNPSQLDPRSFSSRQAIMTATATPSFQPTLRSASLPQRVMAIPGPLAKESHISVVNTTREKAQPVRQRQKIFGEQSRWYRESASVPRFQPVEPETHTPPKRFELSYAEPASPL